MNKTTVEINVKFGSDPDVVTIQKSNSSKPIVCGLLGVDTDDQGNASRIYLRNKLHSMSKGVDYVGWSPSGAITTILTRV